MQFDVIIGNPPYQMTGGGGGSNDSSIYHLFVEQAIKLEPRYLSMVIPSRWMEGGRGMDEFRKTMLSGQHICHLVDYPNSAQVFPSVDLKSGVCYFLWDKRRRSSAAPPAKTQSRESCSRQSRTFSASNFRPASSKPCGSNRCW